MSLSNWAVLRKQEPTYDDFHSVGLLWALRKILTLGVNGASDSMHHVLLVYASRRIERVRTM